MVVWDCWSRDVHRWLLAVNSLKTFLKKSIGTILYFLSSLEEVVMIFIKESCGRSGRNALIRESSRWIWNPHWACKRWQQKVVEEFLEKGPWKEAPRIPALLVLVQKLFIFNTIFQIHLRSLHLLWVLHTFLQHPFPVSAPQLIGSSTQLTAWMQFLIIFRCHALLHITAKLSAPMEHTWKWSWLKDPYHLDWWL